MRLQRPDIHTAARPENSRPGRRGLDASPDFRTLFRGSGRRVEWLLGVVLAPDFPDRIYFCRTLGGAAPWSQARSPESKDGGDAGSVLNEQYVVCVVDFNTMGRD
jgi:hypothetical protein